MARQAWLITGTSTGFGYYLVKILLARGDKVAATARNLESLGTLKEQYGEQLWMEALDVTNVVGMRKTVDRAFAELGEIDVVVSNAGYGLMGAAEELSDEQIEDHRH